MKNYFYDQELIGKIIKAIAAKKKDLAKVGLEFKSVKKTKNGTKIVMGDIEKK